MSDDSICAEALDMHCGARRNLYHIEFYEAKYIEFVADKYIELPQATYRQNNFMRG